MNRNTVLRATVIALTTAGLIASLWVSAAAAAGIADYRAALVEAGYSVATAGGPVGHTTLHATGQQLTLTKGGEIVALELIEYPSREALLRDFVAVNGSGPTPSVATTDFDGRVLYWNENVVMALSFAPPNEPGLTRAAADIFLGRRGTGGPAAATAANPTTGTKLPATGTGDYGIAAAGRGGSPSRLRNVWLAATLAGAALAATGVVASLRHRR